MTNWWSAISLVGSMAVMAPAGIAVAGWLIAGNWLRLALHWCLLFGGGMLLVVASKVAFLGWGIGVASVGFAGFSGHAMRGAAVLPVVLYVLLKNASAPARRAGVFAGCVGAVLIAVSRVVVRAHTVSEAVTGCLLGLLVAWLFIGRARASRELVVNRPLVALSLCLLLLTPKIEPLPTEQWMVTLSLLLSGHERAFTRSDWQLADRQRSRR